MGVYVVSASGETKALGRYYCTDETKELHEILKQNHDLLPGAQIDPENPRRWILVKHEMPVVDPGSGSDRWSLDLFFLDQDAIPTFVECKRFNDTRSRREVVAQMIDYAANSHYYLDASTIQQYANDTAIQNGSNLDEVFNGLGTNFNGILDYFERSVQNLKDGRVRLIFLLEDSPNELRTLVSFLNGQMTRAEVLIVELKFYVLDGLKVVTPNLYGYTEQAYVMKKDVEKKETRLSAVVCVDDESFLKALEGTSGDIVKYKAIELFNKLDSAKALRSYSSKTAKLSIERVKRPIIMFSVQGDMYVDVNWADKNSNDYILVTKFIESFGLQLKDSSGKKLKPNDIWCERIDSIVGFFKELQEE